MPEIKSAAQIAREASEAASCAARLAADAELAATLDSINHVKDFATKANGNSFDASKLKSAWISRYGLDKFSLLCGRSR
jgi:hypothetical protein